MNKLREETAEADAILKQKQLEEGPKAAFGYGGKFGVQTDRFVFFQFFWSAIWYVVDILCI